MALDTGTEALAKLAGSTSTTVSRGLRRTRTASPSPSWPASAATSSTGGFTTPRARAVRRAPGAQPRRCMETYSARHGLAFAPHGKTSMAPQLFAPPDSSTAPGASPSPCPHQVRVCAGVRHRGGSSWPTNWSIAAALRWIVRRAGRRPGLPLRLLRRLRARRRADGRGPAGRGRRPPAGRRGASWARARVPAPVRAPRPTARRSPTRSAAARTLRLAGVAGYEGEVPDADPERVHAWLRRLVALAAELRQGGALRRRRARSW